jgi:hypothetical protein
MIDNKSNTRKTGLGQIDPEKKYLIIKNKGEVEEAALYLIGASSKRDSDLIGFFGSGNKYAIANMLRRKIPFDIYSGKKRIKIEERIVKFRDKDYPQIIINGKETSLTTEMGHTWETWFCIREFYCNALDEGGAEIYTSDTKQEHQAGVTTIVIKVTNEVREVLVGFDNYFIKREPIDTCKTRARGVVKIFEHNNIDNYFKIYRKGINVSNKTERKSLFLYDSFDIEINESRVFKYAFEVNEIISAALAVTTNQDVILKYINGWRSSYEYSASWSCMYERLSDEWYKLLKDRRITPESFLASNNFEDNITAVILPDELCEKLNVQFPDLLIEGQSRKSTFKVISPSQERYDLYVRAKTALEAKGYKIDIPVLFVRMFNKTDLIGWYDKDKERIYLCIDEINSYELMAETLLEEYFHFKGYYDGTRNFTDKLLKTILSLENII